MARTVSIRPVISESDINVRLSTGEQLDRICQWLRSKRNEWGELGWTEPTRGSFMWRKELFLHVKYLSLGDAEIQIDDPDFEEHDYYRGPDPLYWLKEIFPEKYSFSTASLEG